MCLGAFDHKDHNCNKLAEEEDPTTERAQLNKFIHFYSRYQTHQQSLDLEDKLMGVAEATMKELSEKGAAWIDVQYIKQATIALNEARSMLKYTYVYGYFLPSHVNRSIFEYLQGTALALSAIFNMSATPPPLHSLSAILTSRS